MVEDDCGLERERIPHQSQSRRGQRFEGDNCIGIITTTTGARPDYTHRLGNFQKKVPLSKLITERCPTQVAAATGGVWTTDEPTSWEWFLFYFFFWVWRGEEDERTRKAQVHLPGVIGSLLAYLGANQRTKGYKQDEEFG